MTSATPPGCSTVSPYLVVSDVKALLEFAVGVLDGVEIERISRPDGGIGHAEVRIGESVIMMGGCPPGMSPMPAGLYVYVADADATYRRALAAGAISKSVPEDKFYGDRVAGVQDGNGNLWWIATRQRTLSAQEIQAAMP